MFPGYHKAGKNSVYMVIFYEGAGYAVRFIRVSLRCLFQKQVHLPKKILQKS